MDKLFIIVKGGRVEEIYSTKTETELYAEILDFDSKVFSFGMRRFGN